MQRKVIFSIWISFWGGMIVGVVAFPKETGNLRLTVKIVTLNIWELMDGRLLSGIMRHQPSLIVTYLYPQNTLSSWEMLNSTLIPSMNF